MKHQIADNSKSNWLFTTHDDKTNTIVARELHTAQHSCHAAHLTASTHPHCKHIARHSAIAAAVMTALAAVSFPQ